MAEAPQEDLLEDGEIGGGGPTGDRGAPSGCQGAAQLVEECGLVRHVGEGLDRDGSVEGVVGKGVGEPVPLVKLGLASSWGRLGLRDRYLLG